MYMVNTEENKGVFFMTKYWFSAQYNVWCIKNCSKLSIVLLLSLVRILMHQTLSTYVKIIKFSAAIVQVPVLYTVGL